MLSRVIQWSAALAVGAVLLAAPAKAATLVPMSIGDTNTLALDTQYLALISHPGTGDLSGSDSFFFEYAPPPYFSALNSTTNLTIGASGFSSLTLSWIGPLGSGVNLGPLNAIANLTNVPLPLTLSGIYELVIAWALPDSSANGTYTTSVLTPTRGSDNNPLPLPPALVLFGTALVGLTALGRRRRQRAPV